MITNFCFKLRERVEISKNTKTALKGHGEDIFTLETKGQMLQRVMPELLELEALLLLMTKRITVTKIAS